VSKILFTDKRRLKPYLPPPAHAGVTTT